MAFSVIDSGCLVWRRDAGAVFAIKDRALAPLLGDGFEPGISFHFEHIERDEFPSVCAVLFVDAGEAGRFSYDYFFMPDSPADTGALSLLCDVKSAEVWFFDDDSPQVRFSVSFDEAEAEKITLARSLAIGG